MFNFWPFNRQLQIILAEVEIVKANQVATVLSFGKSLARIEDSLARIEKALKITGIAADHESVEEKK